MRTGAVALAAATRGAGVPADGAERCAELETTQSGLNACFARAFEASDRELNAVYRQLAARLKGDPDRARLLVAAQRAWIGFRDAGCAFEASGLEGASARPMVENQCMDAATRRRVEDLKAYSTCPEGDVSCPVPPPGQ